MKVLVATDDRLGEVMAGSALRAWELACALRRRGFEVRTSAAAGSTVPGPGGPSLVERIDWSWPDAVVAAPWSLPPRAFVGRHLLVIDGVTPLLAELATMPEDPQVVRRRRTAAARLPLVAARADAVLVASAAQRHWWQSVLAKRAGRVPVVELPFGVSADPARDEPAEIPGVPRRNRVVLWWGGVWPWLDLETLLAARARLGAAPISVVVPVAARPGAQAPQFGPEQLGAMRERHRVPFPRVVGLESWVPYRQRGGILNRAEVLAVLHHPGPEAELSFRTRALDGVWAGVPLLLSEGGAVAELARANGWGAVTPPGDPGAVAAAMELLLTDREQERCRAALVRDRANWGWDRLCDGLGDLLPSLPGSFRGSRLVGALRAALVASGLVRRSAP